MYYIVQWLIKLSPLEVGTTPFSPINMTHDNIEMVYCKSELGNKYILNGNYKRSFKDKKKTIKQKAKQKQQEINLTKITTFKLLRFRQYLKKSFSMFFVGWVQQPIECYLKCNVSYFIYRICILQPQIYLSTKNNYPFTCIISLKIYMHILYSQAYKFRQHVVFFILIISFCRYSVIVQFPCFPRWY